MKTIFLIMLFGLAVALIVLLALGVHSEHMKFYIAVFIWIGFVIIMRQIAIRIKEHSQHERTLLEGMNKRPISVTIDNVYDIVGEEIQPDAKGKYVWVIEVVDSSKISHYISLLSDNKDNLQPKFEDFMNPQATQKALSKLSDIIGYVQEEDLEEDLNELYNYIENRGIE